MITVNVKEIVGRERTPSKDGAKLGTHLAEVLPSGGDVTLNVVDLAPEDLVSSFVNSVFYAYEQETGYRLTDVGTIQWVAKFPSEEMRLRAATDAFEAVEAENKRWPREAASGAR